MELSIKDMPLNVVSIRRRVEGFLAGCGLRLEPVDYYAAIIDGDEIVCGGGYADNTIKCVAVSDSRRGEGISAKLISHLYTKLRRSGVENIFLYTKPGNEELFCDINFYPVGSTSEAVLLESRKDGVSSYIKSLERYRTLSTNGAIVMNANPFTLGHLHLVETAKEQCDILHVFVVEEDKSLFPFSVRKRLVEEATAGIKGVVTHSGGPYIISSATFPTYFLKENSDTASIHARLDIDIFGRHIAPALNIVKRFAGEEPDDPLTDRYNSAMRELLPAFGVAPVIIPRKQFEGSVISASKVRGFATIGNWPSVKNLVPKNVFRFLQSEEACKFLNNIIRTRA